MQHGLKNADVIVGLNRAFVTPRELCQDVGGLGPIPADIGRETGAQWADGEERRRHVQNTLDTERPGVTQDLNQEPSCNEATEPGSQSIDELSTMLNGAVLAAETAGPNLRVRDKRPSQLRAAERTSHQRWERERERERELRTNSSPKGQRMDERLDTQARERRVAGGGPAREMRKPRNQKAADISTFDKVITSVFPPAAEVKAGGRMVETRFQEDECSQEQADIKGEHTLAVSHSEVMRTSDGLQRKLCTVELRGCLSSQRRLSSSRHKDTLKTRCECIHTCSSTSSPEPTSNLHLLSQLDLLLCGRPRCAYSSTTTPEIRLVRVEALYDGQLLSPLTPSDLWAPRTARLPAGGAEMRQAASNQGRPGRESSVENGERTEKSMSPTDLSWFEHVFALKPRQRGELAHGSNCFTADQCTDSGGYSTRASLARPRSSQNWMNPAISKGAESRASALVPPRRGGSFEMQMARPIDCHLCEAL
ncbi:unnamed protein product [Pleuronectes platessa]|uniref:Uncharacterized protein n=1 Tax=Pleuronectes platessa TaxID=8262 RepID=A0A9N7Y7T5_PLEPL|nr:unnamed protein product [Pleuronectes platessa]